MFQLILLGLAALTGCSQEEKAPPAVKVEKYKTHNPLAQEKFNEARLLWTDSEVCSAPRAAIALLNETIVADRNFAEAYVWRGLAKSELDLRDEAFDDATQGIRLNPMPEFYAYRGLISMRGDNMRGARADYDRSIAMDPEQTHAWSFRGSLNFFENNMQTACKDLQTACRNGDCGLWDTARAEKHCN